MGKAAMSGQGHRVPILLEFPMGGFAEAQVGAKILGLPPVTKASGADLFGLARTHIMQGYFAEPKYGGNREYASWESVGHICHFNYPKTKSSCPPHTM